jgi:hypothetical protein
MAVELDSLDKLSAPQGSTDACTCLSEPGHRSASSPEILHLDHSIRQKPRLPPPNFTPRSLALAWRHETLRIWWPVEGEKVQLSEEELRATPMKVAMSARPLIVSIPGVRAVR